MIMMGLNELGQVGTDPDESNRIDTLEGYF